MLIEKLGAFGIGFLIFVSVFSLLKLFSFRCFTHAAPDTTSRPRM